MAARAGRRWTRARRAVQYASLLAFLALFVAAARGGWPPAVVDVALRVDPLAMLAHLLASRVVLATSALALIIVALTLLFGRAWCGWLCPLGTLIDICAPRRKPRPPDEHRAPAETWRGIKHALLLAVLGAALLGNLTLLILDPLTLLFRALVAGVWPALDRLVAAAETALYAVPELRGAVESFDAAARPALFPVNPLYYRDAWLFVAVLAGVLALNWIVPRFWCRYLCPLGGLLGLLSKVAIVRRRVNMPACNACGACARVCPTATIRAIDHASDPGECTVCMECVAACPRGGNEFAAGLGPITWESYDPGRRQALLAIGAGLAGAAVLRSDMAAGRDHPHLLRPPGARENALLDKCIRCGVCMRACPTGGLQPALAEAGLEGFWTPVLVPRLGYCDYSCNACGQACPVEAIPPLALDDKRTRVIGAAYIDQNRCLAWSDRTPCIVCEEMCPLPEKAIVLEPLPGASGEELMAPRVIRERCIGCGICEYKCPVGGQAAIVVCTGRET